MPHNRHRLHQWRDMRDLGLQEINVRCHYDVYRLWARRGGEESSVEGKLGEAGLWASGVASGGKSLPGNKEDTI
ncbi:MAG: hypothetical protein GTO53_05235 [Planctomycetales bacterium]|nr:hypothetical protein [Planctomycetales bacterium]NIM08554.1 hypothetical protein [Planctomycetales bacterium]NIN08023.1 hypothetical protein [Planctomycetales bacterium]NIN77161.1 hypothetical protein [Planctomycetales bacterium]NIO34343.1 hypothetical protein [Planctomycetales bacterium]